MYCKHINDLVGQKIESDLISRRFIFCSGDPDIIPELRHPHSKSPSQTTTVTVVRALPITVLDASSFLCSSSSPEASTTDPTQPEEETNQGLNFDTVELSLEARERRREAVLDNSTDP